VGTSSGTGTVLVIHTPDKSGLPSVALGAGAARFGLPSGDAGTLGSRCFAHCAEALISSRSPYPSDVFTTSLRTTDG
jgi:hypothetical protein